MEHSAKDVVTPAGRQTAVAHLMEHHEMGCRSALDVHPGLEWAPPAGQGRIEELTLGRAFEGWKPMAKHRTCSIEFKRQDARARLAAEDAPPFQSDNGQRP